MIKIKFYALLTINIFTIQIYSGSKGRCAIAYDKKAEKSFADIFEAINAGNVEAVKKFIEEKADLTERNSHDHTAAQVAGFKARFAPKSKRPRYLAIVKLLKDAGAQD